MAWSFNISLWWLNGAILLAAAYHVVTNSWCILQLIDESFPRYPFPAQLLISTRRLTVGSPLLTPECRGWLRKPEPNPDLAPRVSAGGRLRAKPIPGDRCGAGSAAVPAGSVEFGPT